MQLLENVNIHPIRKKVVSDDPDPRCMLYGHVLSEKDWIQKMRTLEMVQSKKKTYKLYEMQVKHESAYK